MANFAGFAARAAARPHRISCAEGANTARRRLDEAERSFAPSDLIASGFQPELVDRFGGVLCLERLDATAFRMLPFPNGCHVR